MLKEGKMKDKELTKILIKHLKWLRNERNGEKADLSEANLSDTIFDGINWLAYIGILPDNTGIARAYKVINNIGEGIYTGGINYLKGINFNIPKVDPDVFVQCSTGIHLATLAWCLNNKQKETDKLLMFSFNVKDAICPVATDGKFRVKKCSKIGECDWKGNLLANVTKVRRRNG